jgi:hypothetical protein
MMFETFLFSKLLQPVDPTVAASFGDLAPDNIAYNKSSFVSRYRHFSAFAYAGGTYRLDAGLGPLFNRRRSYHTSHGESELWPIDPVLLGSGRVQDLLLQVARCLPIAPERYAVGVNQIRVRADDEHMGSPAPSLHQDGYAFSCHIAVRRENVSGGTSIISRSPRPVDVILEHALEPGEFIFFNDTRLYHTATPVTCRIGGVSAWRDMLILDFVPCAA